MCGCNCMLSVQSTPTEHFHPSACSDFDQERKMNNSLYAPVLTPICIILYNYANST